MLFIFFWSLVVSLFIILGIVIIALIGFLLLFKSSQLKSLIGIETEKVVIPQQIIPINDFVQGCVEESSKYSLFFIGQRGGYSGDNLDYFSMIEDYNEGDTIMMKIIRNNNGFPRFSFF